MNVRGPSSSFHFIPYFRFRWNRARCLVSAFEFWRIRMSRFSRILSIFVPTAALAMGIQAGSFAVEPLQTFTSNSPGVSTTKSDSDDFGAGGHRETDTDSAGGVLQGRVYDPHGNLREKDTDEYATVDGEKHKVELRQLKFDEKEHLTAEADIKYDSHGIITDFHLTHFGNHGERSWEQTTNYQPGGVETSEWNAAKDTWTSSFVPYKKPDAPKPGAAPQPAVPTIPTTTNIGLLLPRDYHPGDTITGSLWSASYAEAFKGVPGLSEVTVPLKILHLPDGSPLWPGVEIGVPGNGYFPVNSGGQVSIHVPTNWTGPLELHFLEPDAGTGLHSVGGTFKIGDPVAAPKLPTGKASPSFISGLQHLAAEDLINLWNEAFDLETEVDEYYRTHDEETIVRADVSEIEEHLNEVYEDIDEVASHLPPAVVIKLARGMARETRATNADLRSLNPNAAQELELQEYDAWARFLDDEADNVSLFRPSSWIDALEPFWTTPVVPQGKLVGVHGPFSGDAFQTPLSIDGISIPALGAAPGSFYFMPPVNLTAGEHNIQIDTPGMPPTILPIFHMTLTMSADQLSLRKGQSTAYHVRLDGLNGLPASAWNGRFIPGDLVSPSESDSQSAGNSLTGSITLTVTNGSPGVITMQNAFVMLDAKSFAPSGFYQINGVAGAIGDGGFSIFGVARAYLNPVTGFGSGPNSPDSSFPSNCSPAGASPECMGSMATAAYNDATAVPNSTTVGDTPPKTTEKPEVKKDAPTKEQVEEAHKRALDAEKKKWAAKKKAEDAKADAEKKARTAEDAWGNGVDHVADAIKAGENLRTKERRVEAAKDKAEKARDNFRSNHSKENDDGLKEAERDWGEAQDDLTQFRLELWIRFTKADRDALKAAREAARAAEGDAARAETEAREARDAADAAQKAWKAIEPPDSPEVRVPIG
jgi:hypothetical protein